MKLWVLGAAAAITILNFALSWRQVQPLETLTATSMVHETNVMDPTPHSQTSDLDRRTKELTQGGQVTQDS